MTNLASGSSLVLVRSRSPRSLVATCPCPALVLHSCTLCALASLALKAACLIEACADARMRPSPHQPPAVPLACQALVLGDARGSSALACADKEGTCMQTTSRPGTECASTSMVFGGGLTLATVGALVSLRQPSPPPFPPLLLSRACSPALLSSRHRKHTTIAST